MPGSRGSAVPTEGACVIHSPSLHRLGCMELLLNPWQILLRELHLLVQMLETRNAEVCHTLAFHPELQFSLQISHPARGDGAPSRLLCAGLNATVPVLSGQIQECC